MITFKEYTIRKLKAASFFLGGTISLVIGMISSISFPPLAWVFLILALFLMGYGGYKMNKLRYERENEGARLYHYKGKF